LLTVPNLIAFLGCASLGLLLAHRLHAARLRRRQICEPALRVHVSLQRLRRMGEQAEELSETDVAALREKMSWRHRRAWDAAWQNYRTARLNGLDSVDEHLAELLALTALR
jgi:hypothetical protein